MYYINLSDPGCWNNEKMHGIESSGPSLLDISSLLCKLLLSYKRRTRRPKSEITRKRRRGGI